MLRQTLILTAALIFSLGVVGSCFAEESKYRFFDMQKFMTKSVKAKELQKKFAELLDLKRTSLENKKKELMTMGEELQKQSPMLKEEKRNEKIIEIKKKEVEYQLMEKEAQNAVQNEEREAMEILQRDIAKVVGKIREQKGLSIVFMSHAIASADDALDITDDIVKAYDSDTESGKPAAKPKPAGPAGPAQGPAAAPKPKPDSKK